MANPQKENGYTPIANEIIDQLCKVDLTITEFSILLVILRKTYGFQKKKDAISLSQFTEMTNFSKRAVIYAQQNLEAKNIIFVDRLMGERSRMTNIFSFNKDYDTWVVHNSSLQNQNKKKIANLRSYQRKVGGARLEEVVHVGALGSARMLPKVVHDSAEKSDNRAHTKEKRNNKRKSPKPEATDDTAKIIKFTPEDVEQVQLLVSLIQKNTPLWKMKGNPDKWAEDINKLHRIDGYTYEQIAYMIRWTQKDSFWSQNILSAAKLREKFNDLVVKVKGIKTNAQKPNYVL